MASKTVWIVGGVVVAIGAIAYLSYNKAPAGKDAAGTIVEAKRARADGTNSFNPSPTASTTDQNASDASKSVAGPDAAKDAAGAASGSGDNMRRAQFEGGGKNSNARVGSAEAADAAAAAGSGANDNIHSKARLDAAKASDTAAAARGVGSQSRNGSGIGASTAPSAIEQRATAESMQKD
jgi:hypothetical protein